MPDANRPTLIMIDGHALAYRQYFALPADAFSTADGEPTNAVYGFARTLLDILEKDKPDYLLVTFDKGLSGRDERYPDYKGTREKMPDDLRGQIERIHELVRAFNIPILELDGYEADDVMGTLTLQAEAKDLHTLIVTGDRDLLQLVTDATHVRLPPGRWTRTDQLYDVAAFREKYDLNPPQLVDLKALMGDSSDNIPGVAGVGEKGATKLLQQYETLDGIYANLEEVSTRYRKKLAAGREDAYLSYDLARILRDVPVELDLEACVAHDFDRAAVIELFRQLEFRTLVSRLPGQEVVAAAPTVPTTPQQLSMFDDDPAPAAAIPDVPEVVRTVIVQDEAVLDELVRLLSEAEAITFDVETTSTNQMQAVLVGIALAARPEEGYYIPVGHIPAAGEGQDALLDEAAITQLPLETVIDALREPLTNPAIPKVAHNAAYDLVVMRRYGIDVTPIGFDTMIAEWLRDPASRNKGLKNLALAKLGVEMTPIDTLIGSGRNQITMDRVPIKRAAPYAAADAAITHTLVGPLRHDLEKRRVHDLYVDLELPLIPILADMEMAGVLLDVDFLREMSGELGQRLREIEQKAYERSGGYGEFNLNSPKQLNDVLFGKLRLPTEGIKKTTHGFSTAANVLEDLKHEHPIVPLILEHRELAKLQGTYVDALPELVNPATGRLHTSFNQTGTVTGRISSDNPNLQNIPVRTALGRQIRKAFVAPEGQLLLAVDYSQVELRVLAHISGDEKLLTAFREGQDIHRATAAAIHNVPFADVSYEQRRFAKAINFGLLYGMGAFRLARDSDLTLAQAETFIETYFRQFPSIRAYLDKTRQQATAQGYLETLLGRRRYFPELSESSGRRTGAVARQRAERQAINMPIQGTAADIMKLAMIQVHQRLRETHAPARMLLQVHDELVLEVEAEALDAVTALVRETMEAAFKLDAPLRADAQYGQNWLDMQDYAG